MKDVFAGIDVFPKNPKRLPDAYPEDDRNNVQMRWHDSPFAVVLVLVASLCIANLVTFLFGMAYVESVAKPNMEKEAKKETEKIGKIMEDFQKRMNQIGR